MISDSVNPKKAHVLLIIFGCTLGVLALFGLNQFVLGKAMEHLMGVRGSQFFYVIIRALGLIFLARALVLYAQRNRFQVLTTVLLVGFIDQVFIKGLWIQGDMRANPAAWQDFHPSNAALFVNLASGYLFMVPIVLILCFLGMESVRFRKDWSVEGADPRA